MSDESASRQPLDVLLIEDSDDDAELIQRALGRSGFEARTRLVVRAEEVRTALSEERWDIVLSDHVLPDIDSAGVLEMSAAISPDLPLILVSGAIGEEAAVSAMRRGAADYVSKDHLERLGPAIRSCLRELESQRARIAAESRLAESEQRFRVSFENAPIGMAMLSADPESLGRFLWVNATMCEIAGLSQAEALETEMESIGYPEDIEADRAAIRALLAGEIPVYSTERRYTRPDGMIVWGQMTVSVIRDEAGEPLNILAQVVDLTERRQTEEELRRSRHRLAEAERVAHQGSFEWEVAGGELRWSDELYRIYGLEPGVRPASREWVREHIYPEDRSRVEADFQKALEERSSLALDCRIVRADGRVRMVRGRAELVVDEAGRASRMIGAVHDVTEVRAAEEALERSSAELDRRAAELHRFTSDVPDDPETDLSSILTERQLEILALAAEGLTNVEIGRRLFVTSGTVKWHMRQILRRVNASNRTEAVARYLTRAGSGAAQRR